MFVTHWQVKTILPTLILASNIFGTFELLGFCVRWPNSNMSLQIWCVRYAYHWFHNIAQKTVSFKVATFTESILVVAIF